MAMRRYQPPMPTLTPGWGPITSPANLQATRHAVILKVARVAATLGVLTIAAAKLGILERPFGYVTPFLAYGLGGALHRCLAEQGWRGVGRALVAGALIAGLVVVAVGTPAPAAGAQAEAKVKVKPVKVEAAQAQATDHAKDVVSQLAELVATAFTKAKEAGR